ncbi:hypothetical protein BWQ96_03035 [Gracilariopsis chorda]|uniref:Uncharacterized protein n=1 Tax=Gracilariopsis chorda TaxID=448386 RepID=A0A2V3J1J0_9FLOR|nr:hypothetical protein BWQ96_03035 [Gracilariopsis chorda]|eukprot:PXF47260.1 hypothetical protein BWQ96_03035 [Gracilariopsis chorda]
MGQDQSVAASKSKEPKPFSTDSSEDSNETRIAKDDQGKVDDSIERSLLPSKETGKSKPFPIEPPKPRVKPLQPEAPLSSSGSEVVLGQIENRSDASRERDDLEDGVPTRNSKTKRPHPSTTLRSKPHAFGRSDVSKSPLADVILRSRIPASGLKPPRPQPRIAPMPPIANSPSSSFSGSSSAGEEGEPSKEYESVIPMSDVASPAPTPPGTPDRQADEEAPFDRTPIPSKTKRKARSSARTMLVGFGLTAVVGPVSLLVPVFWPKYRERKTFAAFVIGVLSALSAWLVFAIILAIVVAN